MESESDMSGRSLKGKMSRQNALDHQDGDDHAKEEKERCSDEKRTKVAEEEPQAAPKQQLIKSQAEDAGTADSTLINSPPQPRNAWWYNYINLNTKLKNRLVMYYISCL